MGKGNVVSPIGGTTEKWKWYGNGWMICEPCTARDNNTMTKTGMAEPARRGCDGQHGHSSRD